MNITPISEINSISDISKQTTKPAAGSGKIFGNMLTDMINNLNETEAAVKKDIIGLATGDSDALHNIRINAEKAELATLLLIQVRNKALDAYNEIMRVTL